VLVRGLPADGAVARSFGWDDRTELLARIVDRLSELAWITRAVNSDGDPGNPPPPTPRPGDVADPADDPRRMSTVEEVKAFFGGSDAAGAGFAVKFTPTGDDTGEEPGSGPAERMPSELGGQVLSLDLDQELAAGE
jgi:hypothetical protein